MPSISSITYYHPSRWVTNLYRQKEHYRKNWGHSPRNAKGELDLRSLGYSLYHRKDLIFTASSRDNALSLHGDIWNFEVPNHPSPLGRIYANLEASSYAKMRGKLYKGSAALGVTLGSYKQSREMIVRRYQQMTNQWEHLSKVLSSRNTKRGDQLASAHLELIFGWKPLLSDIHAAALTVVQSADAIEFVRASSSTSFHETSGTRTAIGKATVTRAASVRITNPNRWLLERYGLLNPAAVAWDLVPYSFIVNMFVNTGQLVNSITDFAGLSFDNGTLTKKARWLQEHRVNQYGKGYLLQSYRVQDRTVGNATVRPPLVFKVPEVSWELAAMAGSLFTQKTSGLFVRLLRQPRAFAQ